MPTEQEQFWKGPFGADYIARNQSDDFLANNIALFARALAHAPNVDSCIEFGANVGMNLRALRVLYPSQGQHAIEINDTAADQLAEHVPADNITRGSILDFEPSRTWDLTLIKGVLIHIDPKALPLAYDKLYAACGRYLLVCEYYSRNPETVPYRGHENKLFKRDFAGEIMDRHESLKLIDYGFSYHRDPVHPQDDISWFLMEKMG